MADIELVIKIPEEMYKWVNDVNKFFDGYGISDFIDLVKNGIPLPKGHGRLIDMKKLQKFVSDYTEHDAVQLIFADREDYLPTIIEADGGDAK